MPALELPIIKSQWDKRLHEVALIFFESYFFLVSHQNLTEKEKKQFQENSAF